MNVLENCQKKVWGRKSSSNVQALLWCLHELELDYERVDAGFTYGVNDTDAYLKMNPNGKVPTLVDGDNPAIFETGAIMRYLANNYAPESFWPTNKLDRARVDMWAEWSKINIAANFTDPLFWGLVRMPQARRDPAKIVAGHKLLNSFLRIANEQLAQTAYLAANQLTLADIQFGHILFRYYDIDLPRTPFEHIDRYYELLTQREAFQSAVMVSYEELRNSL